MPYLLVFVPLAFAVLAFAAKSDAGRPRIVLAGGVLQGATVAAALGGAPIAALGGWLVLDARGKLVLALTSTLFFVCSLYVPAYLRQRSDRPNRVFCACLLLLQAMLTLSCEAHHLGLMWVAMEAATLSSAPLITFSGSQRALEATWKYLLIGSVGIALALLGSLFLAYSELQSAIEPSLLLDDLVRGAPKLSRPWLHAAFVTLLVGYGTKMGLAPMHTWKPDAYGEAPGVVGTLLAGSVTAGAFLAIVRFFRICHAAGEGPFAQQSMVAFGLASIVVAAAFMARQRDFKRMLAYSSVEHMGILVLGLGVGGAGVFGAFLHMINNGLTKAVLFLSAANIHRAFASKRVADVSGAIHRVPWSAGLFLAGFFAVTGTPPFGPFLSEFTILRAAFAAGRYALAAALLALLAVVFVGMGSTVVTIVQGPRPGAADAATHGEEVGTVTPIVLCLALVLLLGVYVPPSLDALLHDAASTLGGTP